MSLRYPWRTKDCEYCGDSFQCSRYDAKYCSVKCRVAAHREPKLIAKRLKWIDVDISEIAKITNDGMSTDTMNQLQQAARRLNALVQYEQDRRDRRKPIEVRMPSQT